MKKILSLLTVVMLLAMMFSFSVSGFSAEENLLLGKSLLAVGYPSSEYTTLKQKYAAAAANQS